MYSTDCNINSRFPIGSDGQVQFTPARTAVSMYTPGVDASNAQAVTAALSGQLSAEQATLYRAASTVAGDALRVLPGLQPFVPEAETDRVESLRALVRSIFGTLVDEFGRVDEPRDDRVERYFKALEGPDGTLSQFGRAAYLVRDLVAPVTTDDEAMLAGFQLLESYVSILRTTWDDYRKQTGRATGTIRYPMFSQRLQRASVMLPVLSAGNDAFMSAMDSVGFSAAERRSEAARLTTLSPPGNDLPGITVADLTDEFDQLANTDGPSYLADAGQYGLQLLTDQADRLFRLLAPVLARLRFAGAPSLYSQSPVAQVLTHERVSWALDDLFRQLDALAELA